MLCWDDGDESIVRSLRADTQTPTLHQNHASPSAPVARHRSALQKRKIRKVVVGGSGGRRVGSRPLQSDDFTLRKPKLSFPSIIEENVAWQLISSLFIFMDSAPPETQYAVGSNTPQEVRSILRILHTVAVHVVFKTTGSLKWAMLGFVFPKRKQPSPLPGVIVNSTFCYRPKCDTWRVSRWRAQQKKIIIKKTQNVRMERGEQGSNSAA